MEESIAKSLNQIRTGYGKDETTQTRSDHTEIFPSPKALVFLLYFNQIALLNKGDAEIPEDVGEKSLPIAIDN